MNHVGPCCGGYYLPGFNLQRRLPVHGIDRRENQDISGLESHSQHSSSGHVSIFVMRTMYHHELVCLG
jgi:hypothetical protein